MSLHFGYSRCPDCVAAEKPIEETVRSSLPANGVFIECSVGDRTRSEENFAILDCDQWSSLTSWKDSNSLFRKDSKLRLTNIPTLVEWGTVSAEVIGVLMISIRSLHRVNVWPRINCSIPTWSRSSSKKIDGELNFSFLWISEDSCSVVCRNKSDIDVLMMCISRIELSNLSSSSSWLALTRKHAQMDGSDGEPLGC